MKARFEREEREFFQDVATFAFGVSTRFAYRPTQTTPLRHISIWADSLIETHEPTPSNTAQRVRNHYLETVRQTITKATRDNAVLHATLPTLLDKHDLYQVSKLELRFLTEHYLAELVIPEFGGSALLLQAFRDGFRKTIGHIVAPSEYKIPFGAVAATLHLVYEAGGITPNDLKLLAAHKSSFRSDLRTAFLALSNLPTGTSTQVQSEREQIVRQCFELDLAPDEAVFWTSLLAALLMLEKNAEASIEGLFGPANWHTQFCQLPLVSLSLNSSPPAPAWRACMLMSSILYALSEQRRIGPAPSVLE